MFKSLFRRHPGPSSEVADLPPAYGSVSTEQPWGVCHPDAKQEGQVCLFYRVYGEDGGIVPKAAIGGDHSYIGCVDAQLVAPPHTVASIKRYLCKIERVTDYDDVKLYASNDQITPLDDEEHIAILSGTGLGSTLQQPLALVSKAKGYGPFRLKVKMSCPWVYVPIYPEWLPYQKDDVLYADGVTQHKTYTPGSNFAVYRASNAKGQEGWITVSSCGVV